MITSIQVSIRKAFTYLPQFIIEKSKFLTVNKKLVIDEKGYRLHNPQIYAIFSKAKQKLVIAGAGTGKTTTMTFAIANLVLNKKVSPSNILAVTFMKKAQQDMKKRICGLLGKDSDYVTVSTFHSLSYMILTQDGNTLYDHTMRNLDQDKFEDREIVKKIMRKCGIMLDDLKEFYFNQYENSNFKDITLLNIFIDDILSVINYSYNEEDDLEEINEIIKATISDYMSKNMKKQAETILEVVRGYQHYLLNSTPQLRDYGKMMTHAVNLLKKNDPIRKRWQNIFKYIFIDEYQDINRLQKELINLLIGEDTKLFVVGDPRQTIYGWNGSKIEYINSFRKEFPKSKIIELITNNRCHKQIVQLSNDFIATMSSDEIKALKKQKSLSSKKSGAVCYSTFSTDQEEATTIIRLIMDFKKQNAGLKYHDFYILARANSSLIVLQKGLDLYQIPYAIRDKLGDKDDKYYQDKVNLLTVHSAKGLEAEHVFLVGVASNKFPAYDSEKAILRKIKRKYSHDTKQEEERCFYVAITRAKKCLYICYPQVFTDTGNPKEKAESQFMVNLKQKSRLLS